jgi:G6PDH family F420-dependent oxidoreductase
MLAEAIEIIRALHEGDLVTHRGQHFAVDSARMWDLPEDPVRLAVAVAGERAVERFAPLADDLIAVEPDADLVKDWNAVDGAPRVPDGARAIGQLPICWDPDEETARKRAHEQFRWFGGGWSVNADLPTTAGFAGASQYVTPDDVAKSIPCGPDLDRIVEAVAAFWDAGFTDVALVQVGDDGQERFLAEAAEPLLEKLRSAAPG